MLRSIESLKGCTVAASDGEIGSVEEVYFDTMRGVSATSLSKRETGSTGGAC